MGLLFSAHKSRMSSFRPPSFGRLEATSARVFTRFCLHTQLPALHPMEDKSRNKLKRPFVDDDDSSDQPALKRVRFPKGKKTKSTDEVFDNGDEKAGPIDLTDPRFAAKERAKRRNQITTERLSEEGVGFLDDVSVAEETYADDGNRTEDGIQIEAFNLNKEREEGYFDADGNFVEYAREKEIKDAWLDSVEANPMYMGRSAANVNGNDEDSGNENTDTVDELSQEEIGTMKRRIANVLQPGETILQALKRLKGNSNNRKEKMSPETKRIFDQLTEDADKLVQNGDYDVYHERREVFEREAEGYEKLIEARRRGTSANVVDDMFSDASDPVADNPLFSGPVAGTSISNGEAANKSGDDSYDIFGDEENAASNPTGSISTTTNMSSEAVASQGGYTNDGSDYVYDESSGYYYSSSLGYYYDPNTGLYCSATTGKWYKYDEERGEYEELNEANGASAATSTSV